MDWTQVEERIVQDDRNKWDRKAAAGQLKIASDGTLELENAEGAADRFAVSELATTQLCQRLNIPVPYNRRLPVEMRAALANHDFGRLKDNAYLLRGKND